MKTLEFLYQETQIHFLINPLDKNVMVNATEMAKLFNKRTDHYLQNDSTKLFVAALKVPEMSGTLKGEIIENRGRNGIYFNRLLALDFAAWLDVKFRVWVIKIVDELLFAKNEKVAKVINQHYNLISEEKSLIQKAAEENNETALRLVEVKSLIKQNEYQKRKALKDFTNQYEMQL